VLWRTATGLVETLTPSGLQVLFRQATGGAQQEQLHPNKEGYRDVTAQLVRWSNTTKALEPVQRNRPNPWDPIPLGPYAGPLELTPSPESVTLLQPASTVTLQGAGFAPTNAVRITVHSVPTVLGTAFADADGGIELTALIPANLAPGEHLIVATGMDPNGRPYQIYSRIEIRRPVPWSNITLWITSVVLVLLTAPVVIAYLRQRTRRQAASPPSPTV
jgi:hypothetical protein